jgi:SAM-dependent methyltransferase
LGEERYILSVERDREAESLRYYRLQESIVDPVSIRHLETIGVTEGWKCLEVGAGSGSIAEWLSKRVGPTGKVVATDIDTRFLQGMAAPNITVRQHNILKDELEEGQFDLVHCRKLLIHLPEPEKAVKRMADALHPGGWLLVEEDDYGSILSLDVTEPSATAFTEAYRAFMDSMWKRGLADFYLGRRLRGLVEGLGFTDIGQEGWTRITRGGDPYARLHVEYGCHSKAMAAIIAQGIFTEEQNRTIERTFMDPAIYFPWYTIFAAWGRKPAV